LEDLGRPSTATTLLKTSSNRFMTLASTLVPSSKLSNPHNTLNVPAQF
jgi:hypothetical protein